MGASLGAGTSGTLFGSSGFGNFMTRITAGLAALFFILSLLLGNLSSNHGQKDSQWYNQAQQADKTTPEAPEKPGNDIPQ